MSSFVMLSWVFAGVTSIALFWAIYRERFQLVKPSTIFCVFFVIQVQLPSAVQATWIESRLKDPWAYFVLTHVFPLIVLLVGLTLFRRTAVSHYERGRNIAAKQLSGSHGAVLLLASICVFVALGYLSQVPWSSTGLYALIYETGGALDAREKSMKLLDNALLRYAFVMMSFVVAPVLAALLAFRLRSAWSDRNFPTLMFYGAALGVLVLIVSLYGARGPAVMMFLAAAFALSMSAGFPIHVVRFSLALIIVLGIPSAITLRANSLSPADPVFADAYVSVLDRVFGRNIVSNVWTIEYVEELGTFGVSGFPKLASLVGEEAVDVFNVVGRKFRPMNESISANSGFHYAYYACFGFAALFPCMLLLWALDSALFWLRRLPASWLLPCLAAMAVAVSKFTYTFYTTALFSGGFLLVPLFCWFVVVGRGIVDAALRAAPRTHAELGVRKGAL